MSEQTVEEFDANATIDKIERLERRLGREKAARKEAEAIAEQGMRDLYIANTELDSQVSERTIELNTALESADAAARLRLNLLRALNRQVRTPLNGVSGMMDLLKSSDVDNQSLEWIKSAHRSADELLDLFRRLALYMELTELSEVSAAPMDLAELASDVASKWAQRCLTRGQLLIVENECSTAVTVSTDKQRFEQLADEIFSNVVKHGEPGPVRVVTRLDNGIATIVITDSGPGIKDKSKCLEALEAPEYTDSLGIGYSIITLLADLLDLDVVQLSSDHVEMRVAFSDSKEKNNVD